MKKGLLLLLLFFSFSSNAQVCDLWDGPAWVSPIEGRELQNISGISFSPTWRRIYFSTENRRKFYLNHRVSIDGQIKSVLLENIEGEALGDMTRGNCPDQQGACLYLLVKKNLAKKLFQIHAYRDEGEWKDKESPDFSVNVQLAGEGKDLGALGYDPQGNRLIMLSYESDAWLFRGPKPFHVYDLNLKEFQQKKKVLIKSRGKWSFEQILKNEKNRSFEMLAMDIRGRDWLFMTKTHVLMSRPPESLKNPGKLIRIDTVSLRDRNGLTFMDDEKKFMIASRGGPFTKSLHRYNCLLGHSKAPQGSESLWDYARVLGAGNREQGFKKLDPLFEGLHKAFTKERLTEETSDLLHTLRTTGLEMDLERLHRLLPYEGKNGERHVAVWGIVKPDHYSYSMHQYTKRPESPADFVLYAGLTPLKDAHYDAKMNGRLFLGDSQPEKWAPAMDYYLAWFCSQSQLGEQLLQRLKVDLPHTMNFAEQWGSFTFEKAEGGWVKGSYRIDVKKFKKPYPHIYRYLKRLDNLLDLQLEGRIKNDLVLGATLDTREGLFSWDLRCDGRGWITEDKKRTAFFTSRKQTMDITADLEMVLQGVYPELENMDMALEFYRDKGFPRAEIRIKSLPEISLGSNPLTFFPVLFARAFLDVKDELRHFFQNLIDSKSYARMMVTEEGPFSELRFQVESDLLNNLVIRAGFQLMALKLNPNDVTFELMRKFRDEFFDQIFLDYKRVRP